MRSRKRRTLAFESCESRRLLAAELAFDLSTDGFGSAPHNFVQVSDDLMLFEANDMLWRSDGTDEGTVQVSDHNVATQIFAHDGKAIFVSRDGLMASDGLPKEPG